VGDPVVGLLPFLIGYALIVGAYVYWRRRLVGSEEKVVEVVVG
jgi:hypothetical protein